MLLFRATPAKNNSASLAENKDVDVTKVAVAEECRCRESLPQVSVSRVAAATSGCTSVTVLHLAGFEASGQQSDSMELPSDTVSSREYQYIEAVVLRV